MNVKSDKPRGICAVCGRAVVMLADGRIGRHGAKAKDEWPPKTCPGWGNFPKGPA